MLRQFFLPIVLSFLIIAMSGVSIINNYPNVFGVNKPASFGAADTAFPTGSFSGNPFSIENLGADSLTLSPTAQMLQQFLTMDMQAASGDGGDLGELDMTGLAQLKQRGDMLANMMQMKLKNFESNLMASMKASGLDATQDMSIKNGEDGLLLSENTIEKGSIENLLNKDDSWQKMFQSISQLAQLMETLQQMGSANGGMEGLQNSLQGHPAIKYLQQTQPDRAGKSAADFVINMTQGSASFAFE